MIMIQDDKSKTKIERENASQIQRHILKGIGILINNEKLFIKAIDKIKKLILTKP